MKIIYEKEIPEVMTASDLDFGDVFMFLSGHYYKDIFILGDNDVAISLKEGVTIDITDFSDCAVKTLKATLTIE